MKRAVVTGAGGFIGSHLAEHLVRGGFEVRAFVHYHASGTRGWLDGSDVASSIEFRHGDVRDHDSVRRALQGADVVFHLAALIGIPYSYETPQAYVRTNVDGALNDIISFFRFEKRHSNAVKFDDDYYARAATVMKRRIDYEMKYLREPSLD